MSCSHRVAYFLTVFMFSTAVKQIESQTNAEICINNISAHKCPYYGKLKNTERIDIDPKQIRAYEILADGSQRRANSIKLPGKFLLEFGQISVKDDMDFVIGDISVKFGDFIQAVPSAGVACGEGATLICDHQAQGFASWGVAQNFGICLPGHISSCRYCDICKTTKSVEDGLRYRQILPNVGNAGEQEFSSECTAFRSNQQYKLRRRIDLPSLDQLDLGWLRTSQGDKDREVVNQFQKKAGKLVITMNLLNKQQQSNCQQQSFCTNPIMAKLFGSQCQGCDTTSDCQKASSDLRTKFSLVGCYEIEFNFDYKEGGQQQGKCAGSNNRENRDQDTGSPRSQNFEIVQSENTSEESRDQNENASNAEAADPCDGQPSYCCGCRFCTVLGTCSKPCSERRQCSARG